MRRFAKTLAHRESQLPPEKLVEIQSFFHAHDFWSLDDRYPRYSVTDAPTVIFTATSGDGRTKTVRHYHGDTSGPSRLTEIEDGLDAVPDTERWIGRKIERDALFAPGR